MDRALATLPATSRAARARPDLVSRLRPRAGVVGRAWVAVRASGRNTRNDAPPPSRSCDPGPAAVELGEPRRRATARCRCRASAATRSAPGGTARRSPSRSSSGTPGPVVLDRDQDPALDGATRSQIRRSRVVCRAAFISRFSTIRSTFGGIRATAPPDSASTMTVRSRERVEALDGPPRERADVDGAVLRLHDASVQPVDVEQILQQAVELAGVRREPRQQVVAVRLAPAPASAPA